MWWQREDFDIGLSSFQKRSSSFACLWPLALSINLRAMSHSPCHHWKLVTCPMFAASVAYTTCLALSSLETWRSSLTSLHSLTTQLVLQAHCHQQPRSSFPLSWKIGLSFLVLPSFNPSPHIVARAIFLRQDPVIPEI